MRVQIDEREQERRRRSSLYAWILVRILQSQGYARDEAIALALQKYPRARWHYDEKRRDPSDL